MFGRAIKLLPVFIWLCLASGAVADGPEVIVGEIGFPKHVWGQQVVPFDVTNTTDWLKFIIVETDVSFEGSYVEPHRVVRSNFVLEPSGRTRIEPKIEVPSNFGQMTLWIRLYDVVDTLDNIALGSLVFEQPFKVRFRMPEAVAPYFQERLTLPPLVGYHGLFDNELVRLILVMASVGKTIPEIAAICDADTAYVDYVATEMGRAQCVVKNGDSVRTSIPVVSLQEAKAGRELADRIVGKLTAILTANLGRRQTLLDSLKAAGVYSGDSTNFVEGGAILLNPYPLVGGLYLWRYLGSRFIIGKSGLQIYSSPDFCEPEIHSFMYVVVGGDYFNGHHFYSSMASRNNAQSQFGDSIPLIDCKPGFDRKFRLQENVDWTYPRGFTPEALLYDSAVVNSLLRMLDEGIPPILNEASSELSNLSKRFRNSDAPKAVNYWFWNLVASATLDNLLETGTLRRTGNGQYKFTEYVEPKGPTEPKK